MAERKDYKWLDAKNQHIITIHYTHVAKNIANNPDLNAKVVDSSTGKEL